METHYLIDYENAGKNGLKGCENLSSTDHIHMFYTDNSKNTTFDFIINHGKAMLDIRKVPAGDQSLDKHLIAYLGYLVGINTIEVKKVTQKKDVKQNTEKKVPTVKVDPAKKTKLNQQIQQALSRSEIEYRPEVMNEVAQLVTSLYGNEKFMNDVHNALRNMYPDDYLDVYGDIKPVISKYITVQDKNADGNNKQVLHNEIHQILSKANAGKEVIAYVPGLVIRHCDEKNALQTIYRTIIQKFGQKKGLDIYNRIKKHI